MKPLMSSVEINKIISYLNPEYKFFEWGCGGSTVHFSKYVKLYRSIEHDLGWYDTISRLSIQNVELYHYDNRDNYSNYIHAINNYPDIYDIILVDGRCRVKCAINAKQFLKPNGILFVHDFFTRPYYFPISDHYTLLESESIKHTPQTLGVFRNEIHN